MAKRKNSTALFEVMAAHRARAAANSAASGAALTSSPSSSRASAAPAPGTPYKTIEKPSVFSVGKKWLASMLEKRQQARAAAAPVAAAAENIDPNDPTAGITAQTLSARKAGAATSDPLEPAADAETEAASNKPVTYTTVMPTYGRSTDAEPRPSSNQVAFDRDKHQVTLRVRFNTAIISLVALLVVVGTAYIIGKRAGKPASAGAATAPTPPAQPAPQQKQPTGGVLDVANSRSTKPGSRSTRSGEPTLAGDRIPGTSTAGLQPSGTGGASSGQLTPAAPFEDAQISSGVARRTAGLNYCVINRYKADQQDIAIDVSDFLNQHGVPNTIESVSPKLSGPTDGYVIVGTRGFSRGFSQDQAFKDYNESVTHTISQLPRRIRFTPQTEMRKWTE